MHEGRSAACRAAPRAQPPQPLQHLEVPVLSRQGEGETAEVGRSQHGNSDRLGTEHLFWCFWRGFSLLASIPTRRVIIKVIKTNGSLDIWVSPSPTGLGLKLAQTLKHFCGDREEGIQIVE